MSGLLPVSDATVPPLLFVQGVEKESESGDPDCTVPVGGEPNQLERSKGCSHEFCQTCVEVLMKQNCPSCRREFRAEVVAGQAKGRAVLELVWPKRGADGIEHLTDASADGRSLCSLQVEPLTVFGDHQSELSASSLSPDLFESVTRTVQETVVNCQKIVEFNRVIDSVIGYIREDQSSVDILRGTFGTSWASEDFDFVEDTYKKWQYCWRVMQIPNLGHPLAMRFYLDALGYMAMGLSDQLKEQKKSLRISGNPDKEAITCVRKQGKARMTLQEGGGVIIAGSFEDGVIDMLSQHQRRGEHADFSSIDQQEQFYIGGREIKRANASYFKAVHALDNLFYECFLLRFSRKEFEKSAFNLAYISSESTEKQSKGIECLCDYCEESFKGNNSQAVIDLFKYIAIGENETALLSKIIDRLTSEGSSYKDKIRSVINSLEESAINYIKGQIAERIKLGCIEDGLLRILYLCDSQRDWVLDLVNQVVGKLIIHDRVTIALNLIDNYLLDDRKAQVEGMKHIRAFVSKSVEKGRIGIATSLIDKYFLGKPETHEEGMSYIRSLISKYSNNRSYESATDLIDKYFLGKPETHEEGMNYIRSLITKNSQFGYGEDAEHLIDRYFPDNPETKLERIAFIRMLISRNTLKGNQDAVKRLKDKYRL